MEETRLPEWVMFGEMVGGAGCGGGQEKEWMGCFLDNSELSASTPTSGRLQPRTRGNGAGSLALVDYYSHKWHELVSSGRFFCRCHDVFLWCYVCFVLFCFASFFVFMLSLKPLR